MISLKITNNTHYQIHKIMILISKSTCGVCSKYVGLYTFNEPISVQDFKYHTRYADGEVFKHTKWASDLPTLSMLRTRLRTDKSGNKVIGSKRCGNNLFCKCTHKGKHLTKITNNFMKPKEEYVMYFTK